MSSKLFDAVVLMLILVGLAAACDRGHEGAVSGPVLAPPLSTVPEPSPRVAELMRSPSSGAWSDDVKSCIAGELERSPDLEAMTLDSEEARNRLTRLGERCNVVIPASKELADRLQAKFAGRLTVAQLGCVREAFATYSPEELKEIEAKGFVTDDSGSTLGPRLAELLAICSIRSTSYGTTESSR